MPVGKRGNTPRWSTLRFGSSTLKLLNVSKIKGRKDRWPEVAMFEVPGLVKEKLLSHKTLRDFLNSCGIFSKPTRRIERSVAVPSRRRRWLLIVFHGRTSTTIVVWVPVT